MKFIGQFALGGFCLVLIVALLTYGITGAVQGFAESDFAWLMIIVIVFGPMGAFAGAVLALLGLLLQRIFRRPAVPLVPPTDDSTVWPPAPAEPVPAEKEGTAAG